MYKFNNMEEVEGIILVLSCQKHMNTRLKEFKLNKNEYIGWKVFYVIGDLFLKNEYEIKDTNYLYIRCEDSYLHLLKKLTLSMKIIYSIFNIKQGILRCGDDLMFNEKRLIDFLLEETKPDYCGDSCPRRDFKCTNRECLKKTEKTDWMINYYKNNKSDFDNPLHGLKDIDISIYNIKPAIFGAYGTLYYISNKSCKTIIDHMESIKFDILNKNDFSQNYPYIIEDVGISFILYYNYIDYIEKGYFCKSSNPIANHTNKFK